MQKLVVFGFIYVYIVVFTRYIYIQNPSIIYSLLFTSVMRNKEKFSWPFLYISRYIQILNIIADSAHLCMYIHIFMYHNNH